MSRRVREQPVCIPEKHLGPGARCGESVSNLSVLEVIQASQLIYKFMGSVHGKTTSSEARQTGWRVRSCVPPCAEDQDPEGLVLFGPSDRDPVGLVLFGPSDWDPGGLVLFGPGASSGWWPLLLFLGGAFLGKCPSTSTSRAGRGGVGRGPWATPQAPR